MNKILITKNSFINLDKVKFIDYFISTNSIKLTYNKNFVRYISIKKDKFNECKDYMFRKYTTRLTNKYKVVIDITNYEE